MYETNLPKQINPLRLAQRKETLSGHLSTEGMFRVLQVVDSLADRIEVDLIFFLDELNKPLAKGMIQVETMLTCQRCLSLMTYTISGKINWAFVQNDAAAKQIQHHYDPVLVENDSVNLFSQIEDEILLNLPMIAFHQEGSECETIMTHDETGNSKKITPFAELAKFKIKK